MSVLQIAVISVTIVANAWATVADLTRAQFVVRTSDEVGVALTWLPLLAVLKGAAALGLLLGLLGVPVIGTAAAAGLVVFFIGALTAHIRARVFYNIAFPSLYFALAAGSLALSFR